MKSEMESVSDAWREAAKDLGISVEAPYELTDKSGKICRFAAYLPDYGSKNGVNSSGVCGPLIALALFREVVGGSITDQEMKDGSKQLLNGTARKLAVR
jgi:hypothetical protein